MGCTRIQSDLSQWTVTWQVLLDTKEKKKKIQMGYKVLNERGKTIKLT